MEYTFVKKRLFSEKKRIFLHFRALFRLFYVIFSTKQRVQLLFSGRNLQISQERGQGERSRRHAALRYASDCRISHSADFWSCRPRATAHLGRGSFVFIVLGQCRASARKTQRSAPFLYPYKIWRSSLQSRGELQKFNRKNGLQPFSNNIKDFSP